MVEKVKTLRQGSSSLGPASVLPGSNMWYDKVYSSKAAAARRWNCSFRGVAFGRPVLYIGG